MLANRVREYTLTTGTGDVTLAGAMAAHIRFSDAFAAGDSLTYVIEDGDNYEIGTGILMDAATLQRTTVGETLVDGVYDKDAPAAIPLSGSARIYCAATADFLLDPTEAADVIREVTSDAGVTVDGVLLKDGGGVFTGNVSFQKLVTDAFGLRGVDDADSPVFGSGSSTYGANIQMHGPGAGSTSGDMALRAGSSPWMYYDNSINHVTVDAVFKAGLGGQSITLLPGAADHTYLGFNARTATPDTRSGYIGYASTGGSQMVFNNELASSQIFVTNAKTWLQGNADGSASFFGTGSFQNQITVAPPVGPAAGSILSLNGYTGSASVTNRIVGLGNADGGLRFDVNGSSGTVTLTEEKLQLTNDLEVLGGATLTLPSSGRSGAGATVANVTSHALTLFSPIGATATSFGSDDTASFQQSWNSMPHYINPLGNAVAIGGTDTTNGAALQVNGNTVLTGDLTLSKTNAILNVGVNRGEVGVGVNAIIDDGTNMLLDAVRPLLVNNATSIIADGVVPALTVSGVARDIGIPSGAAMQIGHWTGLVWTEQVAIDPTGNLSIRNTNAFRVGGSADTLIGSVGHNSGALEIKADSLRDIAFVSNGQDRLRWDAINGWWDVGGFSLYEINNVRTANGSAGTPSQSFTNDTDTGMYRISTDTLGFSTGGLEALRLDDAQNATFSGSLGVGLSPSYSLDIENPDTNFYVGRWRRQGASLPGFLYSDTAGAGFTFGTNAFAGAGSKGGLYFGNNANIYLPENNGDLFIVDGSGRVRFEFRDDGVLTWNSGATGSEGSGFLSWGTDRAVVSASGANVDLVLRGGGPDNLTLGSDGTSSFSGNVTVPLLQGNLTTGALDLYGGPGLTGANILLYAASHSTQPNDIVFRTGGTVRLHWDESITQWDYKNTSISGLGQSLIRAVDNDFIRIVGGGTALSGGNILLYGGTHATNANDIVFRAGTGTKMQWSDSGSFWTLAGNNLVSVGTISMNGNSIVRDVNNSQLFISAGNATNVGANIVLEGSSSVDANDFEVRSNSTVRLRWDDSETVWDFQGNVLNTLGNTTFSGGVLSRNASDGSLTFSGGSDGGSGGNIVVYGQGHPTQANDIEFRAGGGVELHYDHSASVWNFSLNSVLTSSTGGADGAAFRCFADDSEYILQSYNASAGNAAQFHIRHDLNHIVVENTLGDLRLDNNVTIDHHLTVGGIVSHSAPTELTISSGAITISKSFHTVDTESDAATDDLETINGGSAGDRVILCCVDGARSVTLIDSISGAANLQLAGNCTLNNPGDTIELIFDGTNWLELSRSNNS